MKRHNILDIYESLSKATITDESIDYNRGFNDCVALLKMALQDYEHINLHIENRNLKHRLFRAELALDDKYEDRHILKSQLNDAKHLLNEVVGKRKRINGKMVNLNVIEFMFDSHRLTFATEATNEQVSELWSDAESVAFKGKIKHITDIKARIMQFYRGKGFKCVA